MQNIPLCMRTWCEVRNFAWHRAYCRWCARVIFVKSGAIQSHKPSESDSSQSHLKFFWV